MIENFQKKIGCLQLETIQNNSAIIVLNTMGGCTYLGTWKLAYHEILVLFLQETSPFTILILG